LYERHLFVAALSHRAYTAPEIFVGKTSMRKFLLLLLAALGCSASGFSQAPPSGGLHLPDKFTNLKVLPKDISKDDLVGTMRMFARSLGVRCEHCHQFPPPPAQADFASDQKPEKDVARLMMRMNTTINGDYVSKVKLPDEPEPAKQVNCWTCHRGHVKPETGPPPPPAKPESAPPASTPPPTGNAPPQ
jgi:photosynthetic reaction center cytochrome c subunit